jgi:hypothetical protein
MTEEQTTKMLAVLRAAFPEMKVEDSTIIAWNMGMKDLPVDVVRKVVHDWILDEEWPPKVAQIRKRTLQSMTQFPTIDQAWRMVLNRVKSTYPGFNNDPWEAPQIVKDTLQAIGGIGTVRRSEKPDKTEEAFTRAYHHEVDKRLHDVKEKMLGDLFHELKELT